LYGAFPTDPYSHTPGGKGAQQPGMTGQVKEDILSRFGELGVFVEDGKLLFNPRLLRIGEFLKESKVFKYTNIQKEEKELVLEKDSLCFTYCQVPIVYKLAKKDSIQVIYADEKSVENDGLILNSEISNQIFARTGIVSSILVNLSEKKFK